MNFFDGPVCRDYQATASGQREILTNAVDVVRDMIGSRFAEHAAQSHHMRLFNDRFLDG
jgi:hypothetical protein